MPPEVLVDNQVSMAMDVYSFGVLLWQVRAAVCTPCPRAAADARCMV